jgi:hypothetical protein
MIDIFNESVTTERFSITPVTTGVFGKNGVIDHPKSDDIDQSFSFA